MTNNITSLFSEEQIQAMKAGENIAGSVNNGFTGPETYNITSSVPIAGYGTDIKPRIRDNKGNTIIQERVSRPRVNDYNAQDAKHKLEELNAQQKVAEEQAALDPKKILASLNALDRTVRRLSKQVKALEAKNNDS